MKSPFIKIQSILIGGIVLQLVSTVGCGSSGADIDYVALGASDANGVGAVAPFKGYVFEIRDTLDEQCHGTDLNNLGIPGAKAGDIQNGEVPVATTINPDLITLWTGSNDLVSGDSVEEFEGKLQEILEDLSGTQAQIFIGNLPELELLPKFAEDPDPDVTAERVLLYNEAIARQAAAVGATVVDLHSIEKDDSLISDDGFHPSNDGHHRIAELFLQAITPKFCNAEGF